MGDILLGVIGLIYMVIVNGNYVVIVLNGYCSDILVCVLVNYFFFDEIVVSFFELYLNLVNM